MRVQHGGLFRHGDRDRAFEHGGDHAPEAVLRMAVEKRRLARLYRRKGSEDQDARTRVIERRDGMDDAFRHSARTSASSVSCEVAHEVTKRTAVCVSSTLALSSKEKSRSSSRIFSSGRMGNS